MWPGARLGGCLASPGRKIAALVKAIEEKHPDAQVQDEAEQQAEDLPSGSPVPPEDTAAQEPPKDAAAQEPPKDATAQEPPEDAAAQEK
jgi:hypothetical protein